MTTAEPESPSTATSNAPAGQDKTANTDPYATARANLRDTVKWLAATFSALAAVVLAGSSISGIGKLEAGSPLWWAAGLLLLAAFACICLALNITVALLRSDALHLSDLDPDATLGALPRADQREIESLRKIIDERAVDVLPPNYPTLKQLIDVGKKRRQALIDTSKAMRAATGEQEKAAAQAAINLAQDRMNRFSPALSRVLAYGVYMRFHKRLERAMPRLFALGIVALVCLTAFGAIVQKASKSEEPHTIVINHEMDAATPEVEPLPTFAPIVFATGRADLTPQARANLAEVREALRSHPRSVLLLYAHTDTVAEQGVNVPLAKRRADVVRGALVKEGGVEPARVFVAELPETGLPEISAQESAEQANRAVVLRLIEPQRGERARTGRPP